MPHPIGTCYSNGHHVYLHIPKNMSTSISQALHWEWGDWYVNQPCNIPGFVVIRNPIDRWFSGIRQFKLRYGGRVPEMVRQVLDGRTPVFDEHTQRQTDFILSTFAGLEQVRFEDAPAYVVGRFGVRLHHRNQNRWAADTDPRLLAVLREFYADDLSLYERINRGDNTAVSDSESAGQRSPADRHRDR